MNLFKVNKFRIITIVFACISFIGIFLFAYFHNQGYLIGGGFDYLITIISSLLLLFWGITMVYRTQYKNIRHIIISLVILIFIWIVMRFVKWLSNIHIFSIYIDYLYYIPATMIPVMFSILIFEAFFTSWRHKKIIYIILFALSFSFIVLALTNQLHFWFYKDYQFIHPEDNPQIEIVTAKYGICYRIYLGFISFIIIFGLTTFFFGARKQLSFKQVLFSSIPIICLLIYVTLYVLQISFIRTTYFLKDFAFIVSIFLTFLLEVLLDIGLIQNNGRYYKNFQECFLPMSILDEKGQPIYQSKNYPGNYMEYRKTEKDIGLYKIILIEDVTSINKLQKVIKEENEKIILGNKALEKIIKISEEEASIAHRLQLTNEIEKAIATTRKEIIKLLNDVPDEINQNNNIKTRQTLNKIALLLGYMKQKCMILLEAKEEKYISYESSCLLLDVISEDIKSAGFENVVNNVIPFEKCDMHFISLVNDLLNAIAYKYAFINLDLFVVIDANKKMCRVRLIGDNLKCQKITLEECHIYQKENEEGILIEMEDNNE